MSSCQDILRFENVGRRFSKQETPALSDVNLRVPARSIVALLGASGSGKTTCLRIAAGLDFPDRGRVFLGRECVADGENLSVRVPPEQRQIGLVAQEGALFPHLTVIKNVAYGLRNWSREQANERVEECLRTVDLSGKERRYPHELSGGERQRLALARAIAPAPQILLLDEPFSHLDPALRRSLREEIKQILSRLHQTALLVTHDPEDALAIADRLAVMENGNIIQEGLPFDVYQNPVNRYCAERFGPANEVREPFSNEVRWTRPEEARWVEEGAIEGATPVTIVSTTPLGHRWEVCVRLEDSPEVEWYCHLSEGAFLQPGTSGYIGWEERK